MKTSKDKKTYVIAGGWVIQPMVGMQRFALQILKHMDKMVKNNQIQVIILIPSNAEFPIKLTNIQVVKEGTIKTKIQKHWWEQVIFPCYARAHHAIGIDLASELPIFGCNVYAIHDCIHKLYPQNFSNHKVFLLVHRLKLYLCTHKRNKTIITVSKTSARDIERLYHVSYDQIYIIYNGWEHLSEIQEDDNIFEKIPMINNENYYLSIGSKYQHKNYKWIINTADLNRDVQFVISGTEIFDEDGVTSYNKHVKNIVFTGYLTDGELKALIKKCKALILPSFYEGFGIPPLEALALGKKAIVAYASCLPEIYKNCVCYIDPDIPQKHIDRLLEKNVEAPDVLLTKYTWENAAKRLYKLLVEL